MQLSSKVIKSNVVNETGLKDIITKDIPIVREVPTPLTIENHEDAEILKYQEQYAAMLVEIQNKEREIISSAAIEAERIKKEAFEKGLVEGKKAGYELGHKMGLEEANQVKNQMVEETQMKISNGFMSFKGLYEEYLANKTDEIKQLILATISKIIDKQFEDTEIINTMIFNSISDSKNTKTFIVKCHEEQYEEIKNYCENIKNRLTFDADIFVYDDPLITVGNVVIEKNNGKVVLGKDISLQKVEEIILS